MTNDKVDRLDLEDIKDAPWRQFAGEMANKAISKLIQEVERLRSQADKNIEDVELAAKGIADVVYMRKIDSLTKELEVAGLQRREDYSHIKKLEAENAELKDKIDWHRRVDSFEGDESLESEITDLTTKLASFKKYVEELKQQMSCDHDPVFHEMGYPGYNDACWVCDKCNKYMGNDYEGGPTK